MQRCGEHPVPGGRALDRALGQALGLGADDRSHQIVPARRASRSSASPPRARRPGGASSAPRPLPHHQVERGGDHVGAVQACAATGRRRAGLGGGAPHRTVAFREVCNSVTDTERPHGRGGKGASCPIRCKASTRATPPTSSSRPTPTRACSSRTTAYLESSVHAEFDEWLVTRHQHRTMVEELNGEYVEQWERQRWRLRRRRARQGARRRRRRRRGHLPRRRLGHRHGGAALRRRAAGRHDHRPPRLGRRPGPQPLAGGLLRHEPAPPGGRRAAVTHGIDEAVRDPLARGKPASRGS